MTASVLTRRSMFLAGLGILTLAWAATYFLWARVSFDDGPFFAEPYAHEVADLPLLSSVNLDLFGATLWVLETRTTREPSPRTVFALKDRGGSLRWAKVASAEFGRIDLYDRSPRWFAAGGWVVAIKPERTESGELYLSPFGRFRFFFHSW